MLLFAFVPGVHGGETACQPQPLGAAVESVFPKHRTGSRQLGAGMHVGETACQSAPRGATVVSVIPMHLADRVSPLLLP